MGEKDKHLRMVAACGLLALLEQAIGVKKQSITHHTAGRKNHPRINTVEDEVRQKHLGEGVDGHKLILHAFKSSSAVFGFWNIVSQKR